MNLLQRYTKLKKYKQVPDLSGDSYLEHIDYIIKASTPVKGKDYFDGAKGDKGESIKGDKGDRGEKGESIKGQDGYTPIKGIDYFDGQKGEKGEKGDSIKGADGYTPIKNKDYFDGKDGKIIKSNVDITPQRVRDKLESLEGDARLDASAIKNIGKYASNTIYNTSGGGASTSSGGTWGTITGTLSAQLDLQSVLDGKLSVETDPVFMAWDKDYADLINKPTIPTLTWGAITGTLSTQTDLTDYIDNKILINDTSDNINAIVYAIALG